MVRTKHKSDKVLTIRLPERDLMHLERYCSAEGRTKTEVLRQLIQGLPLVPMDAGVGTDFYTSIDER